MNGPDQAPVAHGSPERTGDGRVYPAGPWLSGNPCPEATRPVTRPDSPSYEGYQDFAAGGKLSCDYLSM
ncbi:hypothetical protein EAG_05058 [Camponotus floridanus]|uniref:Uncharacterized protein n=1 Tax=Camponotus floridanus TaxID=104421 RepID=E2AIS1_CAMFO|nr:hypothetical protein EAG_05058 [Camponotus floridanus]